MRGWIIIGMGLKDVPVYFLTIAFFFPKFFFFLVLFFYSFPDQMFLPVLNFSKWFKYLTPNSVNV